MAAARRPVAGLVLLAPSAPWGVAGSTVEEAASAFSLYALGPFWAQAVDPTTPSPSSTASTASPAPSGGGCWIWDWWSEPLWKRDCGVRPATLSPI